MTTGEIIIIGLLGLSVLLLLILMIRHWMKPTFKPSISFHHKEPLLKEDDLEDLGDYSHPELPSDMTDEQRIKQVRGEDALIDLEDDYDERHGVHYYHAESDPWDEPVGRYSSRYK